MNDIPIDVPDDKRIWWQRLKGGLAKVAHPAKLPQIAINVFWHAKYHRSPANRWLRGVLFELFSDGKSGAAERD